MMKNSIADYVLSAYADDLISGEQIAYEGHVFMVIDDWDVRDKHVYDVLDNMSMKHYNIWR